MAEKRIVLAGVQSRNLAISPNRIASSDVGRQLSLREVGRKFCGRQDFSVLCSECVVGSSYETIMNNV